jgi:hypothetical protein
MKTRDALQQITGQSYQYGDGPLGNAAGVLLHNFRLREAERLADADERAYMAGKGPILAALQRKLAEARSQELCNNGLPMVGRFEAYQALNRARAQYPTDRGLKMACTHLQALWQRDPRGYLAVGDVARVRAHYQGQFPRSVVAQVIDNEVPKVGFQTLPVDKIAQMASQVVGNTDEERQYAYEQVVRANGLAGQRPEQKRARMLLRSLADLAAEPEPAPTYGQQGTEGVVGRVMARMAAYDDPILSRVGQEMPGMPMEEELPPIEEEIPHEESTEVIEEVESPNTGMPMVLELGAAEPEPPGEPEGGMPPTGHAEPPSEIGPQVAASLQFFGQLDDYAGDELDLGPEEEAPIDATEEPGEQTVVMSDPTAPDEMIEVTVAPAEGMGSGGEIGGEPAAAPLPGIGPEPAMRQGRVFAVYAVRGGVVHNQPLERVRAVGGMPAMLRRIARSLREADGSMPVMRHVLADQSTFAQRALVVLDQQCGNYLLVQAQEHGNEFDPTVVSEGQPLVQHNVNVPKDGDDALLSNEEHSQNVPEPLGESTKPTDESHAVSAKKLSPKQVRAICKRRGITAELIENKVLSGERVGVGKGAKRATLVLDDADDLIFTRGKRGRKVSLMHLDQVVGDLMAYAATLITGDTSNKRTAKTRRMAQYIVRPLFSVGCAGCGAVGEYLMPDQPENVRCASCGNVTPAEAVAIQLESRQAAAFPGYVITTDVPGTKSHRNMNARRILAAIKQIAQTDGALVRGAQLEVTVRGINEAGLNRITRILEDQFGVRDAQMTPAVQQPPPQPPAVSGFGQGTQHVQQPPPQPMTQQPPPPPAPTSQPQTSGQGVTQVGSPGQYEQMEQHADPGSMPEVKPYSAARLPVGPGLKHVQVRHPDGSVNWMPVEAASDEIARTMVASFHDGTQVLQVVDSMAYAGQFEQMPAEEPEAESDLSVETASQPMEVEGAIRNLLIGYRLNEVPIDEAVREFVASKAGKRILAQFGDETNPARHMAGATVIRIAKEVYEDPTVVPAPGASPMGMGARRRQAQDPKGPKPRQINEQQDDWVNLPGGGEVLGPDSASGEGFDDPSVNEQVDTIARQPGSTGADTSTQPDTEIRDPKRFDAPKPDSDGHVFTGPGSGWGTSYGDVDLGEDSDTGDNPVTEEMGSESSGAYSNVRSK